jgi:hypothetical protein
MDSGLLNASPHNYFSGLLDKKSLKSYTTKTRKYLLMKNHEKLNKT